MNDILHFAKYSLKWKFQWFVIVNLMVLISLFLMEQLPAYDEMFGMLCFMIIVIYLSVNPFIGAVNNSTNVLTGGHFSSKYLQALPISKMQFIFALVISNLHAFIPIVVSAIWVFVRWKGVDDKSFKKICFLVIEKGFFKTSIFLFLCYFCLCFYQISKLVEMPRKNYNKGSFSHILMGIKTIVKYLAVIIVFACAFIYGVEVFKSVWPFIFVVVIYTISQFWRSYQVLSNEKFSYWNVKQDLIHIGVYVLVTISSIAWIKISKEEEPIKHWSLYYAKGSEIFSKVAEDEWEYVENYILGGGDLELENEERVGLIHALSLANFEKVKGLEDRFLENPELLKKLIKTKNNQCIGFYCDGITPIHILASIGDFRILKKALDKNSDFLELKTIRQQTPLHYAAKSCEYKVAKILLDKGANINSRDASGDTPLITTSKNNCETTTVLLVKKGADLNLKNNDGKTALDLAKESKTIYGKKIRFLLEMLSSGF